VLGFGHVEVGTITAVPQPGNDRPRLFRLIPDRAVINRMGFNNGGLEAALPRIAKAKRKGILGINVGANKDSTDRIADYAASVTKAAPIADYVTINISSPNTPGLRDLQSGAALIELLVACTTARGNTPIFLKVAPDLTLTQIDEITRAAIDNRIDALIVGNTTISRPALSSPYADETGGLSGKPLASLAATRLADFRGASGGALTLIAAGGIDSADEAWARIRAGASMVQLYTALVYEGPGLAARIVRGLAERMAREGFASIAEVTAASR
jgi:dihydroorotate dehydrogenase